MAFLADELVFHFCITSGDVGLLLVKHLKILLHFWILADTEQRTLASLAATLGNLPGCLAPNASSITLGLQAYCDKEGEPLDLEFARNRKRREAEMDKKMKLFHRSTSNYSHQ